MEATNEKLLSESYLSDRQLAERYSVHKSTIWYWCTKNRFPSPVRLSKGITRWRVSDIIAWEKEVA